MSLRSGLIWEVRLWINTLNKFCYLESDCGWWWWWCLFIHLCVRSSLCWWERHKTNSLVQFMTHNLHNPPSLHECHDDVTWNHIQPWMVLFMGWCCLSFFYSRNELNKRHLKWKPQICIKQLNIKNHKMRSKRFLWVWTPHTSSINTKTRLSAVVHFLAFIRSVSSSCTWWCYYFPFGALVEASAQAVFCLMTGVQSEVNQIRSVSIRSCSRGQTKELLSNRNIINRWPAGWVTNIRRMRDAGLDK